MNGPHSHHASSTLADPDPKRTEPVLVRSFQVTHSKHLFLEHPLPSRTVGSIGGIDKENMNTTIVPTPGGSELLRYLPSCPTGFPS